MNSDTNCNRCNIFGGYPYLISSNSPSGGIKLIARSVSNLLSFTHCKQRGKRAWISVLTSKELCVESENSNYHSDNNYSFYLKLTCSQEQILILISRHNVGKPFWYTIYGLLDIKLMQEQEHKIDLCLQTWWNVQSSMAIPDLLVVFLEEKENMWNAKFPFKVSVYSNKTITVRLLQQRTPKQILYKFTSNICVEKIKIKYHKCIDYVVWSLLRSFTCQKFIVNALDFHLSICTEFSWVALVLSICTLRL